ncbi:MAG TPA: CRTAC1 family protein, partial [Planctomycetaceae bacterium]|nr:CRTAC1 family protein [Planctomycetaceae bacterium]
YGDVDNDGDLDLLVTTTGGRARLYRNDVPKTGHWLRIRLLLPKHRRDAYGAELIVVAGDKRFHRILNPASSFLASHDPRAHVGLNTTAFDRIEVRWPDGSLEWEHFEGGTTDREITLIRGEGTQKTASQDRKHRE